MRIMMSAAGSAVAPSIIRHLQSLAHFVIGHDCNGFAELESPQATEFEYLEFIQAHYDDFDVYLPFLDEELRLFCHYGTTNKTAWCGSDTTTTFTSKIRQQSAFEANSLPVPPWTDCGEIIAKPEYGRGGEGTFRTKDQSLASEFFVLEGYIVQRFIDGDEYTVDVLTGMDGAFLFAVPRLRIQANGVSVIGKIVMDPEIIDLARLVVSKFAFRGPINIQIIRERDTGKLYIIELNPRLSGSCIFTVMAGFDILDATIKLWEGKPFVAPDKIEDGLVIRRHYVEERM